MLIYCSKPLGPKSPSQQVLAENPPSTPTAVTERRLGDRRDALDAAPLPSFRVKGQPRIQLFMGLRGLARNFSLCSSRFSV